MAKGTKTGGRQKGTLNKRTEKLRPPVDGLMPADFLMSVMRDTDNELSVRIDAAHKVAPYIHPKLSQIEAKQTIEANVTTGTEAIRETVRNLINAHSGTEGVFPK